MVFALNTSKSRDVWSCGTDSYEPVSCKSVKSPFLFAALMICAMLVILFTCLFAREASALDTTGTSSVTATRYAGTSRYITSRDAALAAFDGHEADVHEAVLVCGTNFPDALAATAYAGAKSAVLLLTATDSLSYDALTAIRTLGISKVTIVGGMGVVGENVETNLQRILGASNVTRIFGASRYDTAYQVYESLEPETWSDTAIVATGLSFPDALSISVYAYAKKSPIFLTNEDRVLDEASLEAVKSFDRVVIVGGDGAVDESLDKDLKEASTEVVRLYGVNRYSTSIAIADWLVNTEGFSWDDVAFTTGLNYPDALAGCALQGKRLAPLILVDDGPSLDAILVKTEISIEPKADSISIFGGEGAVPDAVLSKIEACWDKAVNVQGVYSGTIAYPTVVSYLRVSGSSRYTTSRNLALAAFSGLEGKVVEAVVVNGANFPDALAATSYAGMVGAPIILTEGSQLSVDAEITLLTLGVKKVTIIGGTGVVDEDVADTIRKMALGLDNPYDVTVSRISGSTRYETALNLYKSIDREKWGDSAIIVTGTNYPDALSISPFAYTNKSPIFYADYNGLLSSDAFAQAKTFENIIILGGESIVAPSLVEQLEDAGVTVKRIAGASRYETSALTAQWLVAEKEFSWNATTLATGLNYPDALSGSVLAGLNRAPLLLVDEGEQAPLELIHDAVSKNDAGIFVCGGDGAISSSTLQAVLDNWMLLDAHSGEWNYSGKLVYPVHCTFYDITLEDAAALQAAFCNESLDSTLYYLDPSRFAKGSDEYYQFVVLTETAGFTVEELDSVLRNRGTLQGMGATFISAANAYGINEAFLVALAIQESGGISARASGFTVDGYEGTYYDFFGYGARSQVASWDWDSPQACILGFAEKVSRLYILSTTYDQNTLYKMRWNPSLLPDDNLRHQYSEPVTWAANVADVMAQVYRASDNAKELLYDIPVYLS